MSLKQNDVWLEMAKENFDTCVEQGDYQGCLAVIADIKDQGFDGESRMLREFLRTIPLTKFVKQTPYEF